VPAKDAGALADAIARLIDDRPLRASMSGAGRAYVAAHYDWDENARQMERLYARVLEAHTAEVPAAS
jgi:glycosyltransferase involved in cell wall biosynthesis